MLFGYWLTSGLVLIIAWLTKRFPPQDINALYGYRTPLAMKNEANWRYAQGLMPPFLVVSALLLAGLGLLHYLWFADLPEAWTAALFTFNTLIAFLLPWLWTSRKLKRFDLEQADKQGGR